MKPLWERKHPFDSTYEIIGTLGIILSFFSVSWWPDYSIHILIASATLMIFSLQSAIMRRLGHLLEENTNAHNTFLQLYRKVYEDIEGIKTNLNRNPWSSTTWYDREQRRKSHKFGDFDEGKIYNNAEYLLLRSEGILSDLSLLSG